MVSTSIFFGFEGLGCEVFFDAGGAVWGMERAALLMCAYPGCRLQPVTEIELQGGGQTFGVLGIVCAMEPSSERGSVLVA